jgi:glycerol-3-phosphate O-acyltransferase / dihydroxyacetone phosphate acyltransferase
MLYRLLKVLMQITTRFFFRKINVVNREFIPKQSPLLVLANHPSTFMDPIVLATIIKRKVFFLGKGELFKTKFAKWILPKFNIIPVYRKQDNPDLMGENEKTFQKCFEHLENNGVILMFPEGISTSARKLQTIKTGAARIVLGAEARNDFKLGVQVVNVGLNYSNQHRFNHDLFVKIHAPLQAKYYEKYYRQDEFEAVRNLTADISEQLHKIVIAVEDEKSDELLRNIELLYKQRLKTEIQSSERQKDFIASKSIAECVNYYAQHHPQMVEDYNQRISSYLSSVSNLQLGVNDLNTDSNQPLIASSLLSLLGFMAGFPFYIIGLLLNFIPFELPGLIADRVVKSSQFRGAIGMVTGTFTFLLFYSLQAFLVWHFSHRLLYVSIAIVVMPISGLFAYRYYHHFQKLKTRWQLLLLFAKKSVLIADLVKERENLITDFDKIKNEYQQMMAANQN